MKEKELRESSTCGICGENIGAGQAITFFRVTIERYMMDLSAIQRQSGLAMMFGGRGDLARIMGPDEDMAKPIHDPIRMTVCESCSIEQPLIWKVLEEEREK